MSRKRMTTDETEGAGPFVFENDQALAPGESILYDLRNMEYNGTKGWFRKHLPMDQAVVTNMSDGNAVKATHNGVFQQYVTPNTAEAFSDAGVERVKVENAGSTEIAAGEVVVEVLKEPYDADDAARERKERHPIAGVVEKFTGVSL